MANKEKKKKIVWQQYIGTAIFIIVGAFCGYLMANYIDNISSPNLPIYKFLIRLGFLFIGIYIVIFLQIVIHEAGHLFFGLLSGYDFSSFRVGNFMWVNKNGKIKLKRMSIVGTGGQCLMSPPEINTNEKFPFVLYNLGGSIMNIISGIIFIGLYFLFRNIPYLSILFLISSIIGFTFALVNGFPMKFGTINNDGYNVLSLIKNPEALQSFWLQLKVNDNISKGILLKDMPAEWFNIPSDNDMKNGMIAVIGVFATSRLMDEHKFQEAYDLIDRLLSMDTAIVGLHSNLMICDKIFCELIGENRKGKLNSMLNDQQKKFMKQMKNFPSVIRTEYAYALIAENNDEKAKKIMKQFEKSSLKYPYPLEIENERKLMENAELHYTKIIG